MSIPKKIPCSICHRWFRPDERIGSRQHTCSRPECQTARRKKTQANWRAHNPDYARAWRIQASIESEQATGPPNLPAPLSSLPWDIVREKFGATGIYFLRMTAKLLLDTGKDHLRRQSVDSFGDAGTLPLIPPKDQLRDQVVDST
jgi:hypothetical protein